MLKRLAEFLNGGAPQAPAPAAGQVGEAAARAFPEWCRRHGVTPIVEVTMTLRSDGSYEHEHRITFRPLPALPAESQPLSDRRHE